MCAAQGLYVLGYKSIMLRIYLAFIIAAFSCALICFGVCCAITIDEANSKAIIIVDDIFTKVFMLNGFKVL